MREQHFAGSSFQRLNLAKMNINAGHSAGAPHRVRIVSVVIALLTGNVI
jgi:hypothetical protein